MKINELLGGLVSKLDDRVPRDTTQTTMLEWITQHTRLNNRRFSIKGYEFQEAILNDMHPNIDVIKCSQIGLALALDTPIPTLEGWSSMGELQEGDTVFDENGVPCLVDYVSPIYLDRNCYRVVFDDDQEIIADADHKWYVESSKPFDADGFPQGKGRRHKECPKKRSGVLRTKDLLRHYKQGDRNMFSIPTTKTLQSFGVKSSLDPYFLGLWLGDGNSHAPVLTMHKSDSVHIIDKLEQRGFQCSTSSEKGDTLQILVRLIDQKRGVATTHQFLNDYNLLRNKNLSDLFTRTSVEFRKQILAGLIDSDGSVTKKGRVSFYNTSENLINGVEELLASLGVKYHTRWRMNGPSTTKDGHIITPKLPVAEVGFVIYLEDEVPLMPRKLANLRRVENGKAHETRRRYIVDIQPVDSVPVRCISVTSDSHLFLAGRGMIPTHNTEIQIRKALAFLVRNNGTNLIFSLPNDDMYERISKGRIQPLVASEAIFNGPRDDRSTRSKAMMQFGHSFLYVTPANEGAATSISADVVFNDEVDLSDQKMLALFNSRLQNSSWKIRQKFSTPTFHQYGIDLGYQASDQHHYLVRCEHCNHWNHPEFNRNHIFIPGLPDGLEDLSKIDNHMLEVLDIMSGYVGCEKCHKPLNLGDPELRQWVPKFPTRQLNRGYRVTPFSTPRLDIPYIIGQLLDYKKNDFVRGFFNTVLGQPYQDGSIRLEEGVIKGVMTNLEEPPSSISDQPCWIGIDVGQTCHIVVGTGTHGDDMHFRLWESVPVDRLTKRVSEIMTDFNIIGGTIDRHPYQPTADEIFDLSGHKIYPLEYRGTKQVNVVRDHYDQITHAQADRTHMLDRIAKGIRTGTMQISGHGMHKNVIIEHLRDMVRDEQPEKPAQWVKLTGNDHFFHAAAFCAIAPSVMDLALHTDKADMRSSFYVAEVVQPQQTTYGVSGMPYKPNKSSLAVLGGG